MLDRIRELDALRGIAALMVVFFHYSICKPVAKIGWELGVTGVDLFFIISGFVIFFSLEKYNRPIQFLKRRFFRLFPVYIIAVTITTILILFHPEDPLAADLGWAKYGANLTMFQKYFGYGDIDGPYWTMLIEMQFYLCIALLLFLKKIRYFIGIGVAILALLLGNELVVQPLNPQLFHAIFAHVDSYGAFFGHFPLFFAGIIFYKVFRNGWTWGKGIGIFACYLTTILLFEHFGRSRSFILLPQYVLMITLYFVVFISFVRGKLKGIVNPVTLFYGRISFALYLIHQFLGLSIIIPYLVRSGVDYRQAMIVALGVSTVLAYLLTRFVEEPVIRWSKGVRKEKAPKSFKREPRGLGSITSPQELP